MVNRMWFVFAFLVLLPLHLPAEGLVRYESVLVDVQCYVINKEKLTGDVGAD